MATQIFANNASSLLAASITNTDLQIQVAGGEGALYPNPGATEYFIITLENALGDIEICKCTARATDLLTVVRGQEGTSAQAWTNGVTRVECRDTKGTYENFLQRSGGAMSGDIDMDGNDIVDAVLTGAPVIEGGQTKGTSIRGADGGTSNELVVPSAGGHPTIGGSVILTEANFNPNSVFPAGFIALWWGSVLSIPNGWALCDGLDGRPDLKDRFVVGVGSSYVLGDRGGSDDATPVVASGGSHTHGGVTGSTVLTEANLPAHNHSGTASFTGSRADNGGTGNFIVTASSEQYSATSASFSLASIGSGTGHTHTVASDGTHTHTVAAIDNRPPYMAMYYIIKVDPLGAYGGAGNPDYPLGDQYDMYDSSGSTTYIGGRSTQMQMLDRQAGTPQKLQIHCTASNVYKHTLTENVEVLPPNNAMSGQTINIILKQGGAGSFTVTWASVFKFPGGTPPTLSTAPGSRDMLTCQYDSEDRVWMCVMSTNFS